MGPNFPTGCRYVVVVRPTPGYGCLIPTAWMNTIADILGNPAVNWNMLSIDVPPTSQQLSDIHASLPESARDNIVIEIHDRVRDYARMLLSVAELYPNLTISELQNKGLI